MTAGRARAPSPGHHSILSSLTRKERPGHLGYRPSHLPPSLLLGVPEAFTAPGHHLPARPGACAPLLNPACSLMVFSLVLGPALLLLRELAPNTCFSIHTYFLFIPTLSWMWRTVPSPEPEHVHRGWSLGTCGDVFTWGLSPQWTGSPSGRLQAHFHSLTPPAAGPVQSGAHMCSTF